MWIIKQKADNENIKQTKIAVDFQAKFNRPITRKCISQVGVDEIVPAKLWAIIYGKGHFACANVQPKVKLKMILIVNRNADTDRNVDECETTRCQFCWRVTLYPEGIEEKAPTEVNAAAK